jgi:hypothetical protein
MVNVPVTGNTMSNIVWQDSNNTPFTVGSYAVWGNMLVCVSNTYTLLSTYNGIPSGTVLPSIHKVSNKEVLGWAFPHELRAVPETVSLNKERLIAWCKLQGVSYEQEKIT